MSKQSRDSFRGKPSKPFQIIDILLKRKWKIAILGTLCFLLLSPLAFVLYDTYYVATATLRISPTLPTFLGGSEDTPITGHYHDYARTQVSRIKRLQVLMTALNRLPANMRKQFVNKETTLLQAATGLRAQIQVSQIPRTHLIKVELKAKQAEGLAELTNNIINVYLEKLREEEEGLDNHRLAYLRQERRQLESVEQKQSAALQALSQQTGITDFDAGSSIHETRVRQLQQAYIAAQTATLQARNLYDNMQKEMNAIRAVSLTAAIEARATEDPILSNTRAWGQKTLREIEHRMLGYSPNHPERRTLQARIDTIKKQLAEAEAETEQEAKESAETQLSTKLEERRIHLEFSYLTAKKNEEDLKKSLDEAKGQLAQHSHAILQGKALAKELTNTENLLEHLDSRIYSLQVESKAPGRTTLDSIARSMPHNNLMKYLSMIFAFSFASAAGFVLLRESRDQIIRTPEDVETAIGAPPSWPIPDYREKHGPRRAFSRASIENPHCTAAKAVRSLAVKINKERCNFDARIAVFTGVERGVGCSTILINCAASMAQLCDKVLVIDMNSRAPRLHHFVRGADAKPSWLQAAKGDKSIDECIIHDDERDIDVMCGPSNAELLKMDRSDLIRLLDDLKQVYDFIFIDMEPLLDCDITEFVAIHSDLCIPVILGNSSSFRVAHDTVKLMLRLEVGAIAPVLNWVQPQQAPRRRRRPVLRCSPFMRLRVYRRESRRDKELERLYSPDGWD